MPQSHRRYQRPRGAFARSRVNRILQTSASTESVGLTTTPQLGWFRRKQQERTRQERLAQYFADQGLAIHVLDSPERLWRQATHFDLLLLETLGQVDETTFMLLEGVRARCLVPVVVLTIGHSSEQLVRALAAGADAVWSLDAAHEVLMARCKALLRRWSTE